MHQSGYVGTVRLAHWWSESQAHASAGHVVVLLVGPATAR
jgi:hypothetical protein